MGSWKNELRITLLVKLRDMHRSGKNEGIFICGMKNPLKLITLFIFSVLREKFRLEPEDTGVIKGGTARLICAAPKGTPTPTIFWKKNGKVLDLEKDSR